MNRKPMKLRNQNTLKTRGDGDQEIIKDIVLPATSDIYGTDYKRVGPLCTKNYIFMGQVYVSELSSTANTSVTL